jgi:hypothetical protein
MDEKGVVKGIGVEAGHGAEVVKIFFALEELLNILLNTRNDLLDPLPAAGLQVCHDRSSPSCGL